MEQKVTTNAKHGKAKIFKSPFLERLTKTGPISNIVVYGITILAFVFYALTIVKLTVGHVLGLFLLGVFFWTFAEYVLHRYLFHWVTKAKWSQRFHFVMHGAHHEYPRDRERLLMPPVPGLIMAGILFCLFYVIFRILGIPTWVYAFFPGFFTGYLMYSFIHRAMHIMRPPKGLKNLWRHHSLHHHRYPDKAFGVSNTFWDRIFGTMPPQK